MTLLPRSMRRHSMSGAAQDWPDRDTVPVAIAGVLTPLGAAAAAVVLAPVLWTTAFVTCAFRALQRQVERAR